MTAEPTWGELGPAMRVLGSRQQAFVRAFILEKPGYGAVTRALVRSEAAQSAARYRPARQSA